MIQHEHAYGPLDTHTMASELIDALAQAGLTGRGGAAFASWRKVAATQQGTGAPHAIVIANGAEGEPLSFKDKTLLAHSPHLVLDGLLLVGRTVNATELYLYSNAVSMGSVQNAVTQRADATRIKVIQAADTFISGEASAVVHAIGRGEAIPLDKSKRLSASGLKKRPTLVFNVETLAHIALIARFGATWFTSVGTDDDAGTRLLSISGHATEQVLEMAASTNVAEVLAAAAVDPSEVQAILVGGYHGRWIKPLNYRLSTNGPALSTVRPGAGVIHLLGTGECGLKAAADIARYLARESAKQCGPCMFGLPAMAQTLSALADGDRNPQLPAELERLSALVSGRGACHHPDGFVQLIASALETFSDEVAAHLGGHCLATPGRQS
ncbi:NADH-ubiquinone oxidoreductase-F iron-sulfur binding region domain-containing protein [Arthrobacter psychrolactophilus]